MTLHERRDKMFANYDRGVVTASEVTIGFVSLLLDAPDDTTALSLCDSLPDWFRVSFGKWISDLTERDFAYRWFGIGDSRTFEQIELDAERHQQVLKRLAYEITCRLNISQGTD